MKFICTLLLILSHTSIVSPTPKPYIPSKPKLITVQDYCNQIASRLDKIGYLSVSPEKFSQFLWIVSYCESGHQIAASDGMSIGLWQMTDETKRKLGLTKSNSIQSQAEGYYSFLKALGKKRVRSIKSSVDLHCYNFAPCRNKEGVLSKVTNAGLAALDLNGDSIITKQDLKLFQTKRLNTYLK